MVAFEEEDMLGWSNELHIDKNQISPRRLVVRASTFVSSGAAAGEQDVKLGVREEGSQLRLKKQWMTVAFGG